MLRAGVIALLLVFPTSCSRERKSPPPAPKGSPFETFTQTTPRPGEPAPAFALADTTGATTKLSDAVQRGPVVLVFGSFT